MNDFLSEADAFEQASKASPTDDFLPDYSESATALSDPFYEFKLDRYQVSEDEYEKYGIIPLTRGYFAVVSRKEYKFATSSKLFANVQLCRKTGRIVKIYAARRSTSQEIRNGAPQYIYLHRALTKTVFAGKRVIVDHQNGQSLDCRTKNLRITNQSSNVGNISDEVVNKRTKYHGLPRGVEPLKRSWGTAYRATVRIRGQRIRSKTTFTCPERAGRWFKRMNAVLRPEACLVNPNMDPPSPIKFPPLVEVLTDVPF